MQFSKFPTSRPLSLFFTLLLMTGGLSRAEKPAETIKPATPKAEAAKTREGASSKKEEKADTPKPKEEASPAPAKNVAAKPEVAEKTEGLHLVKAGSFVQKIKVSGTVESTVETPIEMNLKRWGDMTVIKALPHGAIVKKGDTLIELETKDILKKIDDLALGMPAKELELAAAILELESAEKLTPLALAKALREKTQAEQDLVHFEDKSRPMQERAAREDVKEVVEALAYAEEELNQLKKMYEKDDLTEETEEIILRRAENTVLRYKWTLEQTEARSQRALDTQIPREHEALKSNLEATQINWRAGEKSLRDGLLKKREETSAKRREFEELQKTLVEMKGDLAGMKVVAPHDGIVYYGASQRGKWTTATTVDRKLIPGGKLAMREIVMTVVDPAKVQVRLSLNEDQLKDLAEGQSGPLQLKWKPDFKFDSKVASILYVPFPDKTFDAILKVEIPAEAPALMPGMTADAEISVYEKKDAIVIPKSAITKEDDKEAVKGKDGQPLIVKTGRSQGDKVEILEGLKVGDTIQLSAARQESDKEEADEKAHDEEAKSESGKEG